MIFPNFEDTSKTRENGVCREEQGDSIRVDKSRFNILHSVAKNRKKEEMSLLFLQMSVQKLFFSQQFLKEHV